jgi:PEP-CTERM motif
MMTAQSKFIAAVLVAGACVLAPAVVAADPIIPNASFSLGFSGFTSSYVNLPYPGGYSPGLMYPEGTFTVGSNPAFVHDRWSSFGDHTTGDGSMLIVNGNRVANVMVWSTSVEVDSNTLYDFSAWAASTYWRSPSSLAFSINGTVLNSPLTLPSALGSWQQFAAEWNSGSSTTAVLSLINLNTEWNGNDFALDDIALKVRPQVSPIEYIIEEPVPDPGSTLVLLGAGLLGSTRARARRQPRAAADVSPALTGRSPASRSCPG